MSKFQKEFNKMALTLTDATAIYKEMYGDSVADATIFDSNPFLASLKGGRLDSDLGGKGAVVPLRIAPPPCVSGNLPTGEVGFARLVANSVNRGSAYRAYTYTHAKLLGVAHITTDQQLLSDDKAKAFVSIATGEQTGLIQHIAKQLEQCLFEEGFGRIGRIKPGSVVTGTTITLEDQCDGTNFEIGMEIVAAADLSTSAIRAVSTNGAFVTAVAYSAAGNVATVTFGFNVNDATDGISTAVAAGDLLFIRNSRDPASSPVKSVQDGLGSHLPGTSTAHDTFFGVTRTANTRLKGLFVDGTVMPITEALTFGDAIVAANGGKLDIYWCSNRTLKRIQDELQGKIVYSEASISKTAGVNFKAIEFVGQAGNMIRVMGSRGCSDRVMFGLTSNGWSYRTIHEGQIAVYNEDGAGTWLRTTGDSCQMRAHSRGQLVGDSQGRNVRISLGDPPTH